MSMEQNDKTIYSIVDIETTGGRANNHKITEIAIIKFDGEEIISKYSTLINPERNIPYAITRLTGIDNQMVCDSPKFYEIAKDIVEQTEGTVFVAHNVFFDYNIIRREFSELGYTFKLPKLCTVRLARKLLPGHKSYSLGKICKDLEIPITNRHRAMGDALATVELFKMILAKEENEVQNHLLPDSASEITLPAGLNRDDIDSLPESVGIYYLKDREGRDLYIGKSINIQKRVKSHFNIQKKKRKEIELKSQVHSIDYLCVPSEWVSLIIEAHEIKKYRPIFNRSLNRINFRYLISVEKAKDDFFSLKVTKHITRENNKALQFRSRKSALAKITSIFKYVFGIEATETEIEKIKKILGKENFNSAIRKDIQKLEYPAENFDVVVNTVKSNPIKLSFVNNELACISWKDVSYEVNEDPDIKRLVLKKLHNFKSTMIFGAGEGT